MPYLPEDRSGSTAIQLNREKFGLTYLLLASKFIYACQAETSSTFLEWFVAYMTNYPEVQDREGSEVLNVAD